MNQWFYNIAGGIVHKIGEKRTTISEATFRGKREILSKINKARVSYLTILKRKTLSLLLKDETDQFVICLVLPVSFCQNRIAFYPRTVKQIVTALMSNFSLFSASFKNSSP